MNASEESFCVYNSGLSTLPNNAKYSVYLESPHPLQDPNCVREWKIDLEKINL